MLTVVVIAYVTVTSLFVAGLAAAARHSAPGLTEMELLERGIKVDDLDHAVRHAA